MDVILLETIFGIISLLAIICFFNNCGRKDKQIETPPIAKQDQGSYDIKILMIFLTFVSMSNFFVFHVSFVL